MKLRSKTLSHSDIAVLLALIVAALIVFRPWRTLPVDVWDYREFLPVLDQHDTLVGRTGAILRYYSAQGRMNLLLYFSIVLEYGFFGSSALGWQLVRFAIMSINLVLIYCLALRLGISRWGASLTAGLLIVSVPMTAGWLQMLPEPKALLALLLAAYVACGYRDAERWRLRAGVIITCLTIAFLFKEVVGTLGAFVIALALVGWPEPRLPGWPLSKRAAVLVGGAGGVVVGIGALILWVRTLPQAIGGYGMAYGTGSLTVSHLGKNFLSILMPVRPVGNEFLGLLYPTNLLLIAVLITALVVVYAKRDLHRVAWLLAAFGLGAPLLGALVYWPWPKFEAYYGLPFFAVFALLLGGALTAVESVGPRSRSVAGVATVLMLGYGSIVAMRSVDSAAAMQRINFSVANIIAQMQRSDTLVVLGPEELARRLPVRAEELRDYAVALKMIHADSVATIVDASCDQFDPGSNRPVGYLSYSYGCGRFPSTDLRINSPFTWRDWLTMTRVADSLTVDLVGPPVRRILRRE